MANELDSLKPQLLAQMLPVLRESCVMPRLVNSSYSEQAAQLGDTIEIDDIEDLTATDVVPSYSPDPAKDNDIKGIKRNLRLNYWKKSSFPFTDKEVTEIRAGTVPRALAGAVRAVANAVNLSIFQQAYYHAYETVGTQGTTPFGTSVIEAQSVAAKMSQNLAPMVDRHFVLDPIGYYNVAGLPNMQNANQAGTDTVLRTGRVPPTMGFFFHQDQQVPRHTSTATAGGAAYAVVGSAAVGATTLNIDDTSGGTSSGAPTPGDLLTKAGDSQVYSVVAVENNTTSWALTLEPSIKVAASDNDVVTFSTVTGTPHIANLAFQQMAIGFASRPTGDVGTGGEVIQAISDDVSQLSMTYEIKRWDAQTQFTVRALWGIEIVRPQHVVRVFG